MNPLTYNLLNLFEPFFVFFQMFYYFSPHHHSFRNPRLVELSKIGERLSEVAAVQGNSPPELELHNMGAGDSLANAAAGK